LTLKYPIEHGIGKWSFLESGFGTNRRRQVTNWDDMEKVR
jgi:hypothetical protein